MARWNWFEKGVLMNNDCFLSAVFHEKCVCWKKYVGKKYVGKKNVEKKYVEKNILKKKNSFCKNSRSV